MSQSETLRIMVSHMSNLKAEAAKAIKDFDEAYALWQSKGSREMSPVVVGKGPFSNKLSRASNFRLFYLYDPKYVRFSWETNDK